MLCISFLLYGRFSYRFDVFFSSSYILPFLLYQFLYVQSSLVCCPLEGFEKIGHYDLFCIGCVLRFPMPRI